MKIRPDIFSVTIETEYISSDCNCQEFTERQSKYRDFDFLSLSKFNDNATYGLNLLDEVDLVLSSDQMLELTISNIRFTVKQKIDIAVDITRQLIEFAEKPIKLAQEGSGENTYNNKCEVHMPGHSLSLYNEMMIKENCCTDEVQSSLNSGWRIIAACPQPDQRRPDYILGRFNPEIDISGSADR